ncbi:(p)ppGpp synthase/HD superfamily hydrolase [Salirhabdus euzebyi]|uniref:(P)ppGpp synthase/HD superfamily hydrolase n=1 Tax=Salirhabdus euzebyi TaxID=394506 RepID=A0A841Q647_9BACI|nr:HD domain-containing protein [Salirhabdus euzebyi]MBB6453833.1 (p)ppGpp synthase/HD superfamily hydrolase [Salirhabdus euzebyi]
MNKIDQAIQFSAQAHDQQYRKGSSTPYISHPYAVGLILMQHGCAEEAIIAGILHDTVEDTTVTLTEIENKFGIHVARIVEGCSEPNKELSWEERKQHTIEYVKTAPLEIRQVTCADKLHNLRSTRENYELIGEELWNRFKRGKEKQAWYYQSIVESLKHGEHFALIDELEKEVKSFFIK